MTIFYRFKSRGTKDKNWTSREETTTSEIKDTIDGISDNSDIIEEKMIDLKDIGIKSIQN